MAWLAVDENGEEYVYDFKPIRQDRLFMVDKEHYVGLPSGSIEKLIGRKLTFEDDPVEI